MTALDDFLGACTRAVARRAMPLPADDPRREGAAALANAVDGSRTLPPEQSSAGARVPVIDHFAAYDDSSDELVTAYRLAESELPWTASNRLSDGGTHAALAPLNEVRDFGQVIVGLIAIAPDAAYPLHSHPPQELYLPILDGATWRVGGSQKFRELEPDELVYNHPNDVHSIRAGSTPVLALYVLWP